MAAGNTQWKFVQINIILWHNRTNALLHINFFVIKTFSNRSFGCIFFLIGYTVPKFGKLLLIYSIYHIFICITSIFQNFFYIQHTKNNEGNCHLSRIIIFHQFVPWCILINTDICLELYIMQYITKISNR